MILQAWRRAIACVPFEKPPLAGCVNREWHLSLCHHKRTCRSGCGVQPDITDADEWREPCRVDARVNHDGM